MTIDVMLKDGKISADDLVEVFKMFCECYGIEFYANDERALRNLSFPSLQEYSWFEYTPAIGILFFGQKSDNEMTFSGNIHFKLPNFFSKYKRFKRKVETYFSQKPEQLELLH